MILKLDPPYNISFFDRSSVNNVHQPSGVPAKDEARLDLDKESLATADKELQEICAAQAPLRCIAVGYRTLRWAISSRNGSHDDRSIDDEPYPQPIRSHKYFCCLCHW